MPQIAALAILGGLAAFCAITLCVGIAAGRSTHDWQKAPLLILELVLLGAILVLWMFEVWFVARSLMAAGLAASAALIVAIPSGTALSVLAAYVAGRLVFVGYAATGSRARFRPDLLNSLWISRGCSWRPRDFRRG